MTPRISRLCAAIDRLDRKTFEWVLREDFSGWVVRKTGSDEPVKFAAKNLTQALQAIIDATRRAG